MTTQTETAQCTTGLPTLRVTLDALHQATITLSEHVQYDDEHETPSGKSRALYACRDAYDLLAATTTERDRLKVERDELLEAAKMVRDEKTNYMAGYTSLTISGKSYNWLMAAIEKAEATQ